MDERNLREQILAIARETKPQYEEHFFPGVGKVFVKRLCAGEKDVFEQESKGLGARSLALVHCCFDEQGARMFRNEDVPMLNLLDPDLIDKICKAAYRINRYTEEDQAELLKNSNGQAGSL